MENKETFYARIDPMMSPNDAALVKSAYIFAKFGHRAQKRKELDESGQPMRYFEHVRRTAIILMDEIHIYDPELIAACLLHDCLEDTDDITSTIVERMFGSRVARIVTCLTKSPKTKEGYHLRLAHAGMDVVVVKACDRLDNVRSFSAGGEDFARRQSKETLDVYVPIFMDYDSNPKHGAKLSLMHVIHEMVKICTQYASW